MLRVPPDTHELALEQGFSYRQLLAPAACCICDSPVGTFEWSYYFNHSGLWDLWCVRCIEEKLPAKVTAGESLR